MENLLLTLSWADQNGGGLGRGGWKISNGYTLRNSGMDTPREAIGPIGMVRTALCEIMTKKELFGSEHAYYTRYCQNSNAVFRPN